MTAFTADGELQIAFAGSLGSDGCSRLVEVETEITRHSLDITFHGERNQGSCTLAPVSLLHIEARKCGCAVLLTVQPHSCFCETYLFGCFF